MGEFLMFWAFCVATALVVAALWGGLFLMMDLAAGLLLRLRKGVE